ncbi:MAG: heterodisulfide reductase-related iron-sulfur binding cluster [Pseudomonadota bacterium]
MAKRPAITSPVGQATATGEGAITAGASPMAQPGLTTRAPHLGYDQSEDALLDELAHLVAQIDRSGIGNERHPVYLITHDERDTPRGHAAMIEQMIRNGGAVDDELRRHIDRCPPFVEAMANGARGAAYRQAILLMRRYIERQGGRPRRERSARGLIGDVLANPDRLTLASRWAKLGRPLARVLGRAGYKELERVMDIAVAANAAPAAFEGPGRAATTQERRARVLLSAGCTHQVMRPDINDATIRLLARRGVEVEIAAGAQACGAVRMNLGQQRQALAQAQTNIDAWLKAHDREPVDAILTNAGCCWQALRDYGAWFEHDADWHEKAQIVSGLTQDVSHFLADYDMGPPKRWSALRIALYEGGQMQFANDPSGAQRRLLQNAGFAVATLDQPYACCGGDSAYRYTQPDMADALRARLYDQIIATKTDAVAVSDYASIMHLNSAERPRLVPPAVHTVELLDWAYGGPVPRGLEALAKLVSDVPEPARPIRRQEFDEAAVDLLREELGAPPPVPASPPANGSTKGSMEGAMKGPASGTEQP